MRVLDRAAPPFAQPSVVALLAALTALLLPPSDAAAQGYAGTWRGGPTRVQVNVESWGPDCGPRPQNFTGEATGSVRISEDGDHLVIHGTPVRRTDGCWSQNPLVRSVSSSHTESSWRVVCRTRPNDPRAETGTYTLTASDENRLSYRETSRYDWQLNDSRCQATMNASQVFTRVVAQTPTKNEPVATPEETRCTPGDASRLRVRPAEAEIGPGGEVRFTARVVDSRGCPLRDRAVRWELERPAAADGDLDGGLFRAADNAAEAEGEFTVTARSGSLRASAKVVVRTADLSDLIARRASVGVTQATEDFELLAESEAGVSARSEQPKEEPALWPFVIAAGVVLALLLGIAALIVTRGRGGAAAAGQSGAGPAAAEGTPLSTAPPIGEDEKLVVPRACPVCGKEFDDPGVTFCPEDGATLRSRSEPPTAGQALICPTCRRGFAPGVRTCPTDGDELIPYALFASKHKQEEEAAGAKICPKCGERFGRQVTFCGKDGTPLVVVN